MKLQEQFKINDTTIDLGTDGRFKPGSENRLLQKLKGRKDGQDVFERLVKMKAILPIETKAVSEEKGVDDSPEKKPKATKDSSSSKQSDKKDDPKTDESEKTESPDLKSDDKDPVDDSKIEEPANDTEEKAPDYEATGQYEVKHFGGGRYDQIDPKGFSIGEVKGKANADAWLEEMNG